MTDADPRATRLETAACNSQNHDVSNLGLDGDESRRLPICIDSGFTTAGRPTDMEITAG